MAIFDAEGHAWRGFSIAIVWEEILTGIFSTIGRLEHLARCFDPQTRVYTQTKLAPSTAPAELDIAMRAVHGLVWKDWLRGSLEQQQTDLRVYASEAYETMEAFLATWLPLRPYLLFPPESATLQERVIFVSNLETLLGHLRNQSSPAPVLRSLQPSPHLIQRVLKIVFETYREPDLSLETISRMLAISKRHLYRKWKESFDQSFSEYLSDSVWKRPPHCSKNPDAV